MSKFLDLSELITFVAGVSLIDVENLLSIVALGLSIIFGIFNIIFKFAAAAKDKKITEDEKKEILDEIEKIENDYKEFKNDRH